MQLSAIEKALLTGSWDASIPSGAVADLAKQVVDGDYLGVLTSEVAKRVLVASTTTSDITSWDQLLRLNEDDETTVLVLAVAALHGFLQQNWTGPDLPIAPSSIFSTTSGITISDEKLNALAVSELAAGGEPAYHLAQHPFLLRLSQLLLSLPFKQLASVPWWRLRFANVHIQILDEPVPPPPSILEGLAALHDSLPTVDPDLNGALLLEEGLLQHRLGDGKAAAPLFVQAARATGLRYELTGALGKRTKFQQTDVTQLVLLAESRRRESDAANSSNDNDGGDHVQEAPEAPLAPSTLDLNDDTLLERTQFTSSSISAAKPDPDEIDASTLPHIDPNAQPALHPLDSSILLALCLNLRNTSPSDGLTTEQMSPFVSRALTHARNWSVHTLGLLLRSRLEAHRTRTVERSVLQLQALVDQMKVDASDVTVAPVTERLRYIHALALPSKWEMERELATRLLSLGVVRSALEIFERLEMWEEAVGCHQALGKREQGVKVVKELLEGARMEADEAIKRERWNLAATENEGQEGEADEADVEEANKALKRRERLDTARAAKLWCLLGDLEPSNAAQHYTHAWTLSGHTSGRATRSLGGLHFASGQYALAIPCLRAAVAINPLLSRSWFILGCACTREEDWEGAREAFTRCVAIDDTDAESWNNLASAYLRLATSDTKVDGDAAVEPDADADADTDTDAVASTGTPSIPFAHKTLAFKALQHGLRSGYDNWRMWANLAVVATDVGELSEATRALGRVVEERAAKDGAACLDLDVLERVVAASAQDPGEADASAVRGDPNAGAPLYRRVSELLERTILPRISDEPRVFRAYAKLLIAKGRWADALKAHTDAYRCSGIGARFDPDAVDAKGWGEAAEEVSELVEVLRGYGPKADPETDGRKWKVMARSVLRTFMAKSKEAFEGEEGWAQLEELMKELQADLE